MLYIGMEFALQKEYIARTSNPRKRFYVQIST